MNRLKRFFAMTLCLALVVVCFAGCHKKGEIAVTVGDVSFTSGYYACALVYADIEARSIVEDQLSEQGELPAEIKYWDYKIEDTDYVTWVENAAITNLKKIAAVRTRCAEVNPKIELTAEDKSMAKTNADYLWDTYGYSELMEKNGVSKETFIAYMQDGYLSDNYFDYIYGKGGSKAVSDEQISKQLSENYALVNIINVDLSSLSESEIVKTTEKFTAYEKELKAGTKTFEEVYTAYYYPNGEKHEHEEPAEGESAPQDAHATILGNDTTDYSSDNYEKAKAMKVGEVTLLQLEETKGLALIVKKDIMADPYYIEALDTNLRHEVVGDEYEADVMKFAAELALVVNKSSTKQFKVKKIYYPEVVGY